MSSDRVMLGAHRDAAAADGVTIVESLAVGSCPVRLDKALCFNAWLAKVEVDGRVFVENPPVLSAGDGCRVYGLQTRMAAVAVGSVALTLQNFN